MCIIIDLFVSEVKGSMIPLKTSSSLRWPVRGFKSEDGEL